MQQSWTERLLGAAVGARGRYVLERLLGEGGMAAVFEARDSTLSRAVAIKVIKPVLQADPEFVGRFKREAQTVAGLDHPHILPVYDFGETDADRGIPEGLLYLVMRLVRGGSLREWMQQHPGAWPPDHVLTLARQLLPALDAAHRQGIVHRDLKPENVLLQANPDNPQRYDAFLTDFGLARVAAEPGKPQLSVTGSIVGTPAYMAPEQWTGQPLDGRADQYAFGVMLYELLTGEPPYHADTPLMLGQKHLEGKPPPLRSRNPHLSSGLERVVMRTLARQPEARYASGADLLRDLDAAITLAETLPQPPPQPRPRPRKPPLGVLAALAGVVVLALVLFGVSKALPGCTNCATPDATTDATSPPTPTAALALAGSPSPAPTATSIPPLVSPSASAVATAASRVPTPGPTASSGTGSSGTLTQRDSSTIADQSEGLNLRNFSATVQFTNPSASGPWDYGLFFRSTDNADYRVILDSGGSWYFRLNSGGDTQGMDEGSVSGMSETPGATNTLQVIALGQQGFLFVNGSFVTTLDTSDLSTPGDVEPGAGFFTEDSSAGQSTQYSNFSVTPYVCSPQVQGSCGASGTLREQAGTVSLQDAQVDVQDFVATVTFQNPSGGADWDEGFNFCDNNNQSDAFATANDGSWAIFSRQEDTGSVQLIQDGTAASLRRSPGAQNELWLVVLGSVAYPFVNGTNVGQINLPSSPTSGDVDAATAFLKNDTQPGRGTPFQNFQVWAASS